MVKSYVVIGLGRFGSSVCQSLVAAGQQVMAIDQDEELIEEYSPLVTRAVVANAQDEDALRELGVDNFDTAIIAIGRNVQANILTTLIVKELGVPKVIVKAENEIHGRVLERIGADKVVHPERDMGRRVVQRLLQHNILNYLDLSDKYQITELVVNDNDFINKSLEELDLNHHFGLTVIAIKHGTNVEISPAAQTVLQKGDTLSVIGDVDGIEKLDEELNY